MQYQSTKSELGSAKQVNKWRLDRTLKRKTSFRPIEADDIKFAWAAYKQGELKELPGFPPDLTPDTFRSLFEQFVVASCHACWTLIAPTKRGDIPVGFVLGQWGPASVYMVVLALSWLPWSSKRNKVESAVAFFNAARREISFVGYALPEHKKIYELCCKHGIVRRVGTSHVVVPGKQCAVFETIPLKR